jgi:isocitrate dehydrogenase kinase/phosphatase
MNFRGVGFVDELDYQKEATNAETFMEAIAKRLLSKTRFSPRQLCVHTALGEYSQRSGLMAIS